MTPPSGPNEPLDVLLASGDRYLCSIDGAGCAHILTCETSATDLRVPEQLEGHPVVEACDSSFTRLFTVKRVTLPAGLRAIGAGAFKSCVTLREIALPCTLRRIGSEAFRATALSALRIPKSCVDVQDDSFALQGSWASPPSTIRASTLDELGVEEGNPALRMRGGVLCRVRGEGLTAVMCAREPGDVELCGEITSVVPAAFTGVTRIGTLRVSESLRATGREVVFPDTACDLLVIECRDGRELPFPMPNPETARTTLAKLFRARSVDAAQAAKAYDEALARSHDKLEAAKAMLQRLHSGIHLSADAERLFRARLASALDNVCLSFGSSNYWQGFDQLIDANLIDAGGITRAIDVLTRFGEAPAAAYLLQAKRQRFGEGAWDYGI